MGELKRSGKVTPPPAGGPVLRLQIGLEDVRDLTADLEKGFAALIDI